MTWLSFETQANDLMGNFAFFNVSNALNTVTSHFCIPSLTGRMPICLPTLPWLRMTRSKMSFVARKPGLGVVDQVRDKLGCTTTEDGSGCRKYRACTIYGAKTKALIFAFGFACMQKTGFLMTRLKHLSA